MSDELSLEELPLSHSPMVPMQDYHLVLPQACQGLLPVMSFLFILKGHLTREMMRQPLWMSHRFLSKGCDSDSTRISNTFWGSKCWLSQSLAATLGRWLIALLPEPRHRPELPWAALSSSSLCLKNFSELVKTSA